MAGNFNISYIIQVVDKLSPTLQSIKSKLIPFTNEIKRTDRHLKDFGQSMTKIGKSVTNLGKSLTLRLSAPMLLLGRSILKAGMDFEDTQTMFETMLGSAEKAKTLIMDLRTMAIKTPFTETDLQRNTTLLLNYGVSAEKIIPSLTMLGDISGGNVDRFNRLSLAFGQVASVGRLMGQDLLQMVSAGFNPLQIIAQKISEKTGKDVVKVMKALKDAVGKGAISFEMVSRAMEIATSEGGRFYNLMERRSQTASGRLSTLIDKIQILQKELGVRALPYFKKFLEKLIELTDKFANLSPKTQKIILLVILLSSVLAPVLLVVGQFIIILGALFKTFALVIPLAKLFWLAIMNPYATLIIIAITILISKLKIVKDLFGWISKKIRQVLEWFGLVEKKSAETAGKALSNVYSRLGEGNLALNQTLDKSTTLNNRSSLDLTGMFTFANAPKGSRFEMSPIPKNINSNIGVNMQYGGGY